MNTGPQRISTAWRALRYAWLTVPWTPAAAGCAVGIGIAVVTRQYAYTFQHGSTVVMLLRVAFLPLVAAAAFLTSDPLHGIAASLPTAHWMTAGLRIVSALPLFAATVAAECALSAASLATIAPTSGAPDGQQSVLTQVLEGACWCVTAIALAAAVGRTRLHETAGLIGALGAIAVGGAIWFV